MDVNQAMSEEAAFFKDMAEQLQALVANAAALPAVARQKEQVGDYATEVDVAAENLIVAELAKRFPNDAVLSEESFADTEIPDGRIWIIDPICGTSNLARGIKTFCTNIALADKGELIAACVVDYSQNTYLWSLGNDEVYEDDKLSVVPKRPANFGVMIEMDLASWRDVDVTVKRRMADTMVALDQLDFRFRSFSSSLTFAYVATGKVDAFINSATHPWDICASSFLIQQQGGIITGLDGSAWTIATPNAIATLDPAVHQVLLDTYRASEPAA